MEESEPAKDPNDKVDHDTIADQPDGTNENQPKCAGEHLTSAVIPS